METKRTWHKKKSAWARAKAKAAREQAMSVPGSGAISPKTRRSAMGLVGSYFREELRWLDIAERLEARGE